MRIGYYIPNSLFYALMVCVIIGILQRFAPQIIPFWVALVAAFTGAILTGIILDKYKPKELSFFYWWKHQAGVKWKTLIVIIFAFVLLLVLFLFVN